VRNREKVLHALSLLFSLHALWKSHQRVRFSGENWGKGKPLAKSSKKRREKDRAVIFESRRGFHAKAEAAMGTNFA
jgi:hypothetical protein